MIKLDTWEGLAAALTSSLHPGAKAVLTETTARLADYNELPLADLCTILILEPPDRLAELESELGFAVDPAGWEYLSFSDGWYELVFVTGDDGFGFVVLVQDLPEGDQALLDLCRRH